MLGKEGAINEFLVQISRSRAPCSRELKLGEDVKILVEGAVTEILTIDNHDGTYDRVAKVKAVMVELQESNGDV